MLNTKNAVGIGLVVALAAVGVGAANCGDSGGSGGATTSTGTGTGVTTATGTTSTGTASTTATGSGTTSSATGTGSSTSSGGANTLLVKNYLSWCSVSVNGAAANTNATQSVTVSPGMVVPLTATGAPGFMIAPNMWHGVDDDSGTGATGTVTGTTSAETVTVPAAGKCVFVCCPSTTEPCPASTCP